MKILLAPAQFKETIPAAEVANIMARVASRYGHKVAVQAISDGGEGFLESFIAAGGKFCETRVLDPIGRRISSGYVRFDETAIIEMAKASGIELVAKKDRDIFRSSTYGTGELIRRALQENISTVIVSMGGSATNDGGIGMLSALGVKFLDNHGARITSVKNACEISSIDLNNFSQIINSKVFIGAVDVINPLLGREGSTMVFGPQKGLSESRKEEMESLMHCFAKSVETCFGQDWSAFPGAGAAGGLGFALKSFFNAELKPGFDILNDVLQIDKKVNWADVIITGEGKMDRQTAYGKAPARIRELAAKFKKRIIAVAGHVDPVPPENDYGFDALFSLSQTAGSSERAMSEPREWLERVMGQVMEYLESADSPTS